MTDLSDIDALITQFVAEQVKPVSDTLALAENRIQSLTQSIADSNTQLANLNISLATTTKDRDAVKVLLDRYVAKYGPLTETFWLPENFPNHMAGLYTPGGFSGKGQDVTEYRMRDNSSKRAAEIAAIVAPKTNPFYLLWMAGTDVGKWAVNDAIAQDFALYGPKLGHTFGGLFVGPGARAIVRRIFIKGIQGKLNGPPEETGSLAMWAQVGALVEEVVLDGTDENGVAIASSPLMLSSMTDATVRRSSIGGAAYGFAAANWRASGVTTYQNVDFGDSRRLVNIEQAEPGSEFRFIGCRFGKAFDGGYITQVSTRNNGRCKLTYTDCVTQNNVYPVRVYGPTANAKDGGNGMLDSDIRVIENGSDVTSKKISFIRK